MIYGRIVIPIEIRDRFNILEKDSIEVYVEKNNIVLKKVISECAFCTNRKRKKLIEYNEKYICTRCLKKIQERDYEREKEVI